MRAAALILSASCAIASGGCNERAVFREPGSDPVGTQTAAVRRVEIADRAGTAAGGAGGGAGGAKVDDAAEYSAMVARFDDLDLEDDAEIRTFLLRLGVGDPPRSRDEVQRAVSMLVRLSWDKRPSVRCAAFTLLANVAPGSVPRDPFSPGFLDSDPSVRRAAVIGRARHGIGPDWRALLPLLKDPDEHVRAAAADALGAVADQEARCAVSALFDDPSDAAVEAAARSLGRGHAGPAPPEVLAALRSPRSAVRRAGVLVLAQAPAPESFAAIVAASKDPDETVRRAAILALGRCVGETAYDARIALEVVAHGATGTRAERIDAIECLATSELQPNLDRLDALAQRGPDRVVRLATARTLLARSDPRGLSALVPLAGDHDPVQLTASQTLRDVTGADPSEDTAAAWGRLLPGLVERMPAGSFEYSPTPLADTLR